MEKPTRFYSNKQEELVALLMGGKRCPNSGAGHWKKGDIIVDEMIVECKTKTKPSTQQTIKKEWIDNLRHECLAMGKSEWAIVFDFGNLGDEYAVIPLTLLIDLLNIREESLYD